MINASGRFSARSLSAVPTQKLYLSGESTTMNGTTAVLKHGPAPLSTLVAVTTGGLPRIVPHATRLPDSLVGNHSGSSTA